MYHFNQIWQTVVLGHFWHHLFCFVAPWSGGLVFNGDTRFTNVMANMAEKLMAAIGEKEDQSSGKESFWDLFQDLS